MIIILYSNQGIVLALAGNQVQFKHGVAVGMDVHKHYIC